MESAGACRRLARAGLILALAAVGFLGTATAALADVTPSRGGPGPAAEQSGSGSWIEIAVLLAILAAAVAAVLYDSARRRGPTRGDLEQSTAVPAAGSRPTAAA